MQRHETKFRGINKCNVTKLNFVALTCLKLTFRGYPQPTIVLLLLGHSSIPNIPGRCKVVFAHPLKNLQR
jgi:hypothetical protein